MSQLPQVQDLNPSSFLSNPKAGPPFTEGKIQSYTVGGSADAPGALPPGPSAQHPASPAEPPAEVLGNGASRLVPPQQGQWEEDPEGLLPNPPWRPHLTPQAVTSLRGPAGKRIRHPSEFPSCGYYYPQFSSEFGTGALWPAAAAPGSADQRQPPTVPPPSPQPYPHSPFQSMWIHQVDSSSMWIHQGLSRQLCYAKSLQSCPTLCDPIDRSPPGSAVPGILQARTPEWVAISFSNA